MRARRLIAEYSKASRLLTTNDPPIKAVRVQLPSEDSSENNKKGSVSPVNKASSIVKKEFLKITGIPSADTPELRFVTAHEHWKRRYFGLAK